VIFDANELAAAIPTGLTATANANGVLLSWADAATTEYAYKVERGVITTTTKTVRGRTTTTTSTVWTDLTKSITPAQQAVGAAPLANANTFTDTDKTLVAGTTYQYRVTAVGANGNGVTPAINYTVAAAPVTPPTAPSNVSIQRTGTNAAILSWTDASNNETSFQVQTSTNGTTWTNVGAAITRNATQKTATGGTVNSPTITVSNTTNASYRVNAIVDATTSSSSAVVTLNDTVAPAAAVLATPTKAAVTTTRRGVTTRTGTDVTLTWTDTANNNATYTVQYSTNGGTSWSNVSTGIAGNVTMTTHSINGYTPATVANYTYRVLAINSVNTAGVASNTSVIAIP
jgi:predicted RNA-binding protein with TRAM domain